MDLSKRRKLKLEVLNFPEWKKESTCYIFSLRTRGLSPETNPKWEIDTWYKVDYSKPEEAEIVCSKIKLKASFNAAIVYGIWLPNDLAKDIDLKDNPEDYMDLIMKYKFKL